MQFDQTQKPVIYWLYTIMAMVFAMVFIGGVTRLTDSGLSMVDWKPLMGAIPPLNEQQWQDAFAKYQAFPEFQKVNFDMNLAGFKKIFFWEYFHRLFGRLVGIVFFFPFVYFVWKNKIKKNQRFKVFIGFILGGLQGLLGWYMVKSGLVNKPDVSQFRLAAHLMLAFIIIGYLYYIVLVIKNPKRKNTHYKSKLIPFFSLLLVVQIIFGAFVAGLDAGLTHNTFPLMGRSFFPTDGLLLTPWWHNIFENMAMVQFVHRSLGWVLLLTGCVMFWKHRHAPLVIRKNIKMILAMLLIQFTLGVSTLIFYVPLTLASLHQLGALILFMLCVRLLFFQNYELEK